MTASARRPKRTLFSLHAFGFIVIASLVAIWPVFLHGGKPFTMWDSFYYMNEGDRLRSELGGWFQSQLSFGGPASSETNFQSTEPKSFRSLPYSAFIGAVLPLGVIVAIWLQTCLVMTLVYAFIAPTIEVAPRATLFAVGGVMLLMSQLPFSASFFMPDILGAVVVLFAALVARGIESFDTPSQLAIGAITLFSIVAHYGNIPLALAAISLAVLLRANSWVHLRNAFLVVVLCVCTAFGVNLTLGAVALGEFSMTPGRYPILLARSIEDGPARWHLEENCKTEAYAVCEWWDGEIPNNVGDALWQERGMANAPPELYERIRREELKILWRSFVENPIAQVQSLSRNTVRQLRWVGSTYASVNSIVSIGPEGREYVDADFQPLKPFLQQIGWMQKLAFGVAMMYLAYVAIVLPNFAHQRQLIVVLAVAILANAAIFGGLSAPADRYGARVAWIVILAALAFAAERRWAMKSPTDSRSGAVRR